MIWAAATMCFFGLLQVGEAVSPSDPSFEAVSHLAVSDVPRDTHKNPHFLQVHIKASKTDTFRKGVKKKFERERSVERVQRMELFFQVYFTTTDYYDLRGISVVKATMAESLLASPTVGNMTESDVPGAHLSEPLASHTMPELRWWLLY